MLGESCHVSGALGLPRSAASLWSRWSGASLPCCWPFPPRIMNIIPTIISGQAKASASGKACWKERPCRAGRRAQAPRCRAYRANGSSNRGCDLACWCSRPGPFLLLVWVESGCGGSVVGEDLGDRPQPEGDVKQTDHAEGEPCAHRHWVLLPDPCQLKRGPRTQANWYGCGSSQVTPPLAICLRLDRLTYT